MFTLNEALDFCAAVSDYKANRITEVLKELLKAEVEASRRLEDIGFGKVRTHLFRSEVTFMTDGLKVK